MKFRLLAFALLLSGGVSAQNPYISLQGANETAGGLTVAQPRTILAVDVTVEHDVTLSGPYARYAQKYLGVRAPLTGKPVWSVTGAQIALLDGGTDLNAAAPAPASTRVLSHTASENKFARLQPDKTDMTTPALEDAARTAAAQIFSLRRHRIEDSDAEDGKAAGIMKERATFTTDLWDLTSFFFEAPREYEEKQVRKYWKGQNPAILRELRDVLAGIDDFSLENTERIVHAWIEEKGYGMGQVMNTLRLALVGAGKGPGMYDVTSFIGKEETLRRIDNLLTNLKPAIE